jgi:hypothetical protein
VEDGRAEPGVAWRGRQQTVLKEQSQLSTFLFEMIDLYWLSLG